MASVQMISRDGLTGHVYLPAPSGRLVALNRGIGSVYPEDVAVAIQQLGWRLAPGEISRLDSLGINAMGNSLPVSTATPVGNGVV